MVDEKKARRVHAAAWAWVAAHPEAAGLELAFEAAGVRGRHVERVQLT
jgi:Holliday junction resolvase-like predicted endonuclease